MIRIRPYKVSDAKYLLQWQNDEYSFAQWCGGRFQYPLTKEQLNEYYEFYENDEHAFLMMAVDEKGTPIGHFLLRKANYEKGSIHMGFVIIDPNLRGHGYGKEMLLLARKYAKEILGLPTITLGVFYNNASAHQCYWSAGFVDESYVENVYQYNGEEWGIISMVAS